MGVHLFFWGGAMIVGQSTLEKISSISREPESKPQKTLRLDISGKGDGGPPLFFLGWGNDRQTTYTKENTIHSFRVRKLEAFEPKWLRNDDDDDRGVEKPIAQGEKQGFRD